MPHSNCDHTIHGRSHHNGWDRSIPPALTVAPGESVRFECLDSSGGQFTKDSTTADVPNLSFDRINPVTGPVFVDGAKPGDVLKVTIGRFHPSGFGWTANIPGFGLLADQFTEPKLHVWSYDADTLAPALWSGVGRVPLKPFAGTIGVAPAEPGHHSVVPPRRVGGNLDIRDLAAGTTLYLPVEVEGALFSIGDTHAAQGDGEVCVTGIESPMYSVLRFELHEGYEIPAPQFQTPGELTPFAEGAGWYATTGVGPDLMQAAKDAVRAMISHLGREHGLEPEEAYLLCSLAVDLKISEVVDQPNWVVSAYLPLSIFV